MYAFDIGIVIVNYNVRHFLVQCLQSVRNSKLNGLKIEVWVVDNASVDGSVALLQKDFPEINLIPNEKNLGFSTANNQAIKKLNSTYTLLLNPDTILEEDTLAKCYNFMEIHQDAGALGVRMIDGAGKFLPESKRKVPDVWNSFCKLSYLSDLFPTSKVFSGYNLGYLPEFETNEIEVLCGAFMFIRSRVLGEIGLLDEAFFMYGEDIDLSFRIIQGGYKIYYFPETSIIHYKGESTKKSSLNYVRTFYGAMHIYVNKHYSKGNAGLFSIFIKIAITIRAFISGLSRILKNWLHPLFDGVLLFFIMSKIKVVWAAYYFGDATYYKNTNIDITLKVYIASWILCLWFVGHYNNAKLFLRVLTGVGFGTLIILVGYALLPEYMRTSRAIILWGNIVSVLVTAATSMLLEWKNSSSAHKESVLNIAIVAKKYSAEKLIETLVKSNVKYENVYIISPIPAQDDVYYTNDLSHLPKVVRALKIDEVIFSNEDMTMKEIIQSMSTLDSRVSFKIGGDDSLNIIGSNSKNSQGVFYSIDPSYKLSDQSLLKFKRIFDIISSLLVFVLSPILFIINAFDIQLFYNAFNVLEGKKTWVGYGGESSDYSFLPMIPPSVIKYPFASKAILYENDHFKKMNVRYAKEYSFDTDVSIFLNNMFKLANKT